MCGDPMSQVLHFPLDSQMCAGVFLVMVCGYFIQASFNKM